jgi:hypothetical protein
MAAPAQTPARPGLPEPDRQPQPAHPIIVNLPALQESGRVDRMVHAWVGQTQE